MSGWRVVEVMSSLLLFAFLSTACGGAGGSFPGEGPQDAGAVDSGQPDAGVARACRTYVTDYTTSFSSGTNTVHTTCTFDRAKLTLTCVGRYSPGSSTITSSTSWATIADAVAAAHPFGRTTANHTSTLTDSCRFYYDLTYDSLGEETSSAVSQIQSLGTATCAAISTTFTAWDASLRPTAGIARTSNSTCMAQSFTRGYDDANRTVTTDYAAANGCSPSLSQAKFNADGFATSFTSGATTQTNTIAATAQICTQ